MCGTECDCQPLTDRLRDTAGALCCAGSQQQQHSSSTVAAGTTSGARVEPPFFVSFTRSIRPRAVCPRCQSRCPWMMGGGIR
eukprot:scaffold20626_cov105-Isochrysis_galbana.AAC.2